MLPPTRPPSATVRSLHKPSLLVDRQLPEPAEITAPCDLAELVKYFVSSSISETSYVTDAEALSLDALALGIEADDALPAFLSGLQERAGRSISTGLGALRLEASTPATALSSLTLKGRVAAQRTDGSTTPQSLEEGEIAEVEEGEIIENETDNAAPVSEDGSICDDYSSDACSVASGDNSDASSVARPSSSEPEDDNDDVPRTLFPMPYSRKAHTCSPRVQLQLPEKPALKHSYKTNPLLVALDSEPCRVAGNKRNHKRRGAGSSHAQKKQKLDDKPKDKPAKTKDAKGKHVSRRLLNRSVANSDIYCVPSFNVTSGVNVAKGGWQGQQAPAYARKQITERYQSGEIKDDLKHFVRLPYLNDSEGKSRGLFVADKKHRVFLHRGTPFNFLVVDPKSVAQMFAAFMGDSLEEKLTKSRAEKNPSPRGPHLATIIGHWRQSMKEASLTKWHKDNTSRVEALLDNPIKYVSSAVKMVFPNVVKRFDESAKWHFDRSKGRVRPLFGCFWNFCLNGILPGDSRVHCLPHADAKNPAATHWLRTDAYADCFNHKYRSWLAIWEAGIIVELPPWVLLVYPSSLFFHFNIDIHDIKFVTTEGAELPTPESSTPLVVEGDEKGRGSMVWFNMATMFQSSETGFDTLAEASRAGRSTDSDYKKRAQEAFLKYSQLFNVT
ncbi:hypothetical protein BC834DRAFT_846937 [Gloeopeniophorella convolvens]|nr:hypothetical protein BC834DRAFT_846937 [Gloeopeniophorella convolvens]